MKHKKNGFTLVELIVVLVILAILAALLVPALTGYGDKARKSQVIAETRMLHTGRSKRNYLLYTQQTNSLSKISMLYLLASRTMSLIPMPVLSKS